MSGAGEVMHRIILPDGQHRQSAALRCARVFGYLSIGVSGLLILISDALTLPYDVLAGFLAAGGLASAFGAYLRRWAGEFVGIPLAVAGLVSLGLASIDLHLVTTPVIAAANVALLWGFALLLAGRWRAVLAIYRLAVMISRMDEDGGRSDE